ncbi:hypothetical protein PHSY_002823 [Pseudozyma hubeiensis SY62]|uniref:Apple domain-containing protein n=1 Tax=Pseudozyma hubeiensis (strain SY62) TaxID=1305764 RepID=R9P1R5_PSEHS|nr:hypothetical protein PHSY_002823 [Pseudozyma hubeiensis SY62]GAC95248.1 hypothetical protein PHSY_002823 [Pseudozyma hubeiensis SY62]
MSLAEHELDRPHRSSEFETLTDGSSVSGGSKQELIDTLYSTRAPCGASRLTSLADYTERLGCDIDTSDLLSLPDPTPVPVDVISTSVDLAAVATSLAAQQSVTADDSAPTVIPLRKRQGTCKPFSSFASINSDLTKASPTAFQTYPPWQAASGPIGTYGLPIYEGVNSVGPKNGLLSVNAYSTYDPTVCQAKCDSLKSCASFAIWRERVPTQKYDAAACPSPSTDAAYQTKCLYYSYKLAATDATNKGQWTNNGKFNVVQTSVKFFNKNSYVPAAVDGFSGPTGDFGVCAPQAMTTDGGNVLTATGTFHVTVLARDPGPMTTAIDPSFCASTCKAITSGGQPDATSGIKVNCNMFSLFLLRANGKDAWQCQYWTMDLDASRNTACSLNKFVVASWNDSSTFGLRCIEDFKNIPIRSDFQADSYSLQESSDGKPNAYIEYASEMAEFTSSDSIGSYYIFNKPYFYQQDATRLAGDGFFGLVGADYNGGGFTWTASGFTFDLESVDLGRWFFDYGSSSDTMQLQGLRNGQVVTQPTPAYHIPGTDNEEWVHATGLLNLGFNNLDAIRIQFGDETGSAINTAWAVATNLVLTRHAVPTTQSGRRGLHTVSARDAANSSSGGSQALPTLPGFVPTGIVSPIFKIAYKPDNGTSASN